MYNYGMFINLHSFSRSLDSYFAGCDHYYLEKFKKFDLH